MNWKRTRVAIGVFVEDASMILMVTVVLLLLCTLAVGQDPVESLYIILSYFQP